MAEITDIAEIKEIKIKTKETLKHYILTWYRKDFTINGRYASCADISPDIEHIQQLKKKYKQGDKENNTTDVEYKIFSITLPI